VGSLFTEGSPEPYVRTYVMRTELKSHQRCRGCHPVKCTRPSTVNLITLLKPIPLIVSLESSVDATNFIGRLNIDIYKMVGVPGKSKGCNTCRARRKRVRLRRSRCITSADWLTSTVRPPTTSMRELHQDKPDLLRLQKRDCVCERNTRNQESGDISSKYSCQGQSRLSRGIGVFACS
jgi:hypothetical protein